MFYLLYHYYNAPADIVQSPFTGFSLLRYHSVYTLFNVKDMIASTLA